MAGVAAAGAGLGGAELVAGLRAAWRSPVIAVGDRVVDLVPGPVKDLAIAWFGTGDKAALLAGIAVVVTFYAAAVGVVALRGRTNLGLVGVALFAATGAVAATSTRSGLAPAAAVPSLVGGAVTAAALLALARAAGRGGSVTTSVGPVAAGAGSDGSVVTVAAGAGSGAVGVGGGAGSGEPGTGGGAGGTGSDVPGGGVGDPEAGPGGGRPPGRRRFLATVGVVGLGAVASAATGRALGHRFSAVSSRAAVRLPGPASPAGTVPAGAQAPGAAPFLTANADFYRIDTALLVPQVPAETWRLRVGGLVERELDLSYDDLLDRDLIERHITLTCVSNTVGGDLVGTARWLGARLDDLLAEAGPLPGADQVVGRSVDGYTCGFPLAAALDGRDALVAVGMNGEPLPLSHGFPARLVVPGLYGYVSATKWLTGIELTTFAGFDQYWEPRGYRAEAPIKLQSRIDRPRGLERIPAGPYTVAGVAWAQTVGVAAVEVRIDDGDWRPAELADAVSDDTWRQWWLDWEAAPGRHRIEVRAIDRNGAIQTDTRSEPRPDGAAGHHTVIVLADAA